MRQRRVHRTGLFVLVLALLAPGEILGSPDGLRSVSPGAFAAAQDRSFAKFGHALCAVRDVDGDGHADVAVGAPGTSLREAERTGAVSILSGRTGVCLRVIHGAQPVEHFGVAVDSVVSPDPEATSVLFVGADNLASPPHDQAGTVSAFDAKDGRRLRVLSGERRHDAFGRSLLGVVRMGPPAGIELIVGSALHPVEAPRLEGAEKAGESLPRWGTVGVWDAQTGALRSTLSAKSGRGWGDVVMARLPGPGGPRDRRVCFASRDLRTLTIYDSEDWTVAGEYAYAPPTGGFGASVAGYIDGVANPRVCIAVGVPRGGGGDGPEGTPGGHVLLIDATKMEVLKTITGAPEDVGFGSSVCPLGDIDGDARCDFAVGSPSAGSIADGLPGSVTLISGASGKALGKLAGPKNGQLGTSMCAIGDVNKDGVTDFVAGAHWATVAGAEAAGEVWAVSGKDCSLLWKASQASSR